MEIEFGMRWGSLKEFMIWINGRVVEGHSSNIVAVFIWWSGVDSDSG